MLILIEGLDRTGKTSLAADIHAATGCYVHHCSKPVTDDPYREYLDPISRDRDMVLDRGYLGEAVWPHFFDRPTIMGPRQQRVIEAAHRGLGCLLVLCVRNPGEVKKATEEEGGPMYNFKVADQMFRSLWRAADLPKLLYDRSLDDGTSVDDIVNKAMEVAR